MDNLNPLPFFATPDLLPAPLPTIEAIEASQDLLKEHDGRRVVRVGSHFVVKYGVDVALTEGENMLFLKQFSTIQIPDVYAIYSHEDDENKRLPINYIVMENIVGDCLDACWTSLDTEAKSAVVDQLRISFTQLRQMPSPGYYGLVGRRPYNNHIFWAGNDEERRMISGPFDSEEEMLEAFMQKYVYNLPKYRKHEYYSRMLPCVLRDHAPVSHTETSSGRTLSLKRTEQWSLSIGNLQDGFQAFGNTLWRSSRVDGMMTGIHGW